jgi:hypothetical protein
MPHPRKRTWTLGELARDQVYGLFFDAAENRWEAVQLEAMPVEVARHIMGADALRPSPVDRPADFPEDWARAPRTTWDLAPRRFWAVP